MARDHARVNVAIWGDPAFRKLPPPAQHLYLALWTSPDLSYAGTHDWRPGRLGSLSHGWTREAVEKAADCLAARHFIVIDHDTEEVLLRSWLRYDGLMKQPRMAISAINAYNAVYSELIRSVIVNELFRIKQELPDASCWADKRVIDVMEHPRAEAKGWPTPDDPFAPEFTQGLGSDLPQGLPIGLPQTRDGVWVPPTPAPAPTPTPSSLERGDTNETNTRGTRIDKGFALTPEMIEWANINTPNVNIEIETEQFIDYWIAQPGQKGVKLDWVATWRNWMRRTEKDNQTKSGYRNQNQIMQEMRTKAAIRTGNALNLIEGGGQ